MRIERHYVVPEPEEDFAEWVERHDLVVEVRERDPQITPNSERFYAALKGAEIKCNGMLRSTFNNGRSEADAIYGLPHLYSGRTIVFDAYKSTRRELVCPRFKGCA